MVWVCVCFDMGRVKQRSSEPQSWKVLMMKTCLKKNTPNFASSHTQNKSSKCKGSSSQLSSGVVWNLYVPMVTDFLCVH